MLLQILLIGLLANEVAPERWVRRRFEDYPEIVSFHSCNPCRIRIGYHDNLFQSDIRNDSSDFRCRMWSIAGNTLRLIDRMFLLLPIDSDFCQDFNFESMQSMESVSYTHLTLPTNREV